jgi:endonuclease-3
MSDEDQRAALRYICQNLESAYDVPANDETGEILDTLIAVILSQATTNANSDRTFAALKRRFPAWEDALAADAADIADAIRLGGLANQKARVIKDLLRQIKTARGACDLEFLHDLPVAEAAAYLKKLRGVGPKTAACTLLFAAKKDIFPLDTHIFRILRRAGLVPPKATDAQAHALLDQLVRPGKFYSLHINLIRLGRQVCAPNNPRCTRCPIVEYCDYGQNMI